MTKVNLATSNNALHLEIRLSLSTRLSISVMNNVVVNPFVDTNRKMLGEKKNPMSGAEGSILPFSYHVHSKYVVYEEALV